MPHRLMIAVLFCVVAVTIHRIAAAAEIQLDLPLACAPGVDCWVPNYVDLDPGDGVKDYTCGTATYNAPPFNRHRGTDFAIRDLAAMRAGVAVLAAADGRVTARRDGVKDRFFDGANPDTVKGKECGNGVFIDHGDGWATKYCHLRHGSVVVKKGDRVKRGQYVGLVGLSGQTAFPHLHFQVEKDKKVVDPFVGLSRAAACGIGPAPLWTSEVLAQLQYQPTAIYNAGFSDGKPVAGAIRDGQHYAVRATSPALVLWTEIFHTRKDDQVEFRITGPDGTEIFKQSIRVKGEKARYFAFAGKRRKEAEWPAGRYTGHIILRRGGQEISARRQININ